MWYILPLSFLCTARPGDYMIDKLKIKFFSVILLAAVISPVYRAGAQTQLSDQCFAISDGYVDSFGVAHNDENAEDTLAFLNKNTGQTGSVNGQIPNITGHVNIEAMSFEPLTGVLYAMDGGQLGTVDLTTAAFTALPNIVGGGRGYRNGAFENFVSFSDIDGITFDLADPQTLFGSVRFTTGPDLLIKINKTTGQRIEDAFPDPLVPGQFVDFVEVTPIAGEEDVDDLSMDPNSGSLFAIINNGGIAGKLVTIDTTTGATNEIGNFIVGTPSPSDPPLPAGVVAGTQIDDMEGLSFFNDGTLYGSTGKDFNSVNYLWKLNIATGEAIPVGKFSPQTIDIEAIGCFTSPVPVTPTPTSTPTPSDTPTPTATPTPTVTPPVGSTPTPTDTPTPDCSKTNISEVQVKLDGLSNLQYRVVLSATHALSRIAGKKAAVKRFINQINASAKTLQQANWTFIWSLPTVVNLCTQTNNTCVTTQLSPTVKAYSSNALTLRDLVKKIVSFAKKYGLSQKLQASLLKDAEKQLSAQATLLKAIPTTNTTCATTP
jgi:hypothetical protein